MKTIFLTFLACLICFCGQAADKVSYTEADLISFSFAAIRAVNSGFSFNGL